MSLAEAGAAQTVEDDSPPPGFPVADDDAPPGFPSKTASDADALAKKLAAQVTVGDEGVADEPDLALRAYEGLRENHEAQVRAVTADNTIYKSAGTFEDLPLSKELLQGIYTLMKFERPSRIQALTLPMILLPDASGTYRDMIAQAHNGSGKTTCFVLSMLSRVDPAEPHTQALCMCPTRELVMQNLAVCQRMATFTGITFASTAEEESAGDSERFRGRRGLITGQVVIGTHGRLKNWVSKKQLEIDAVRILVFDEADEMLKADAFADDTVRLIRTIRKRNPQMQLLLFSATFNDKIKEFALRIAPNANQVFVPKEELSLDVIKQYNVRCANLQEKVKVLKDMIFPNCEKLGQTIIFVRSRETARSLHDQMAKEGYKCTSIQGDMKHFERDKVVKEFRDGTTKILISTDVLSRGLDVSQVTLVVNYDIPVERDNRSPNFDTYLHRIGRSGRFGRKGAAFNLTLPGQDTALMHSIATYFKRDIPELPANDEEAFIDVLRQAGLTDQE